MTSQNWPEHMAGVNSWPSSCMARLPGVLGSLGMSTTAAEMFAAPKILEPRSHCRREPTSATPRPAVLILSTICIAQNSLIPIFEKAFRTVVQVLSGLSSAINAAMGPAEACA
eukprot:CAMPEP_0206011906 /NCGR_PEP_ID=MMETSP1464-20131121/14002_1 /ASSEMBLY_ACC=CAM_ASM_001124 /TAXON_ID=119497 /ORGANISM="Exanthemachrysis gayraliae, Strain RCC1523" /LENGTH=112 /DNA_ID=CAMNT_0053385585 /DNA_START=415 /DNA_END=750 /DNA_ORIENTATION=+